MSSDLKIENILSRVKEQLNEDKIKLWLPPYLTESDNDDDQETLFNALAEKYSLKLEIDKKLCGIALKELQSHSIEQIKENSLFRETGLATIKVKVSGPTPRSLCIQVHLTDMTEVLTQQIAEQLKISNLRIKLISSGKVLKNHIDLGSQGVKNRMQIMAVLLAENPQELLDNEQRVNAVNDTKEDLATLAGQSGADNELYLQVENQSGKRLKLPLGERKALITAMALHEKGRSALKKEDYSLALINFLEADKEFSTCTSSLLKSVDNYALLHLDIAWCYLCLGNASQIPDAERRLKECEANFHLSYGPNLERLLALKGTTGNEAALFMRLHLLQGIVLFHLNKRVEAKNLLERAETELKSLKVDDVSFSTLLELGLTPVEARLGLRATNGNVDEAAELMHKKREERKEMKIKNKLEEGLDKERKHLGMCADGKQFVEPDFVKQLIDMGFPRNMAAAALKQSNNSIGLAVQLIQEEPYVLKDELDMRISKDKIRQVVEMGFVPQMAKAALKKNDQDVEKAVAELVASGGFIEGVDIDEDSLEDLRNKEENNTRKRLLDENKMKAFERLSEGMPQNADDHLDLLLTQEEVFLKQYLSLLS